MPQVDLETLVSAIAGASSDRKITCETLADDASSSEKEDDDNHHATAAVHDVPPDFPPESFWLSKDAEVDWFDRNAFFERKESTKGVGMTNSGNLNPHSNNNSQRFPVNLKSKASLFGLPKTQKANYVDAKRRANKPANVKLFPRRSASAGKTVVSDVEPTSPKVSCMGRVRSKRCRRRMTSSEGSHRRENSKLAHAHKSRSAKEGKRKKGFYSKVLSIFKSRRSGEKKPLQMEEIYEEERPRKSSVYVTRRMPDVPVGSESESAPGLGAMKNLASGRRSNADSESDAPGLGGMRKLASGRRSTEWLEDADAPGLGGMKKMSSGRRSMEDFDGGAWADFPGAGPTRRS